MYALINIVFTRLSNPIVIFFLIFFVQEYCDPSIYSKFSIYLSLIAVVNILDGGQSKLVIQRLLTHDGCQSRDLTSLLSLAIYQLILSIPIIGIAALVNSKFSLIEDQEKLGFLLSLVGYILCYIPANSIRVFFEAKQDFKNLRRSKSCSIILFFIIFGLYCANSQSLSAIEIVNFITLLKIIEFLSGLMIIKQEHFSDHIISICLNNKTYHGIKLHLIQAFTKNGGVLLSSILIFIIVITEKKLLLDITAQKHDNNLLVAFDIMSKIGILAGSVSAINFKNDLTKSHNQDWLLQLLLVTAGAILGLFAVSMLITNQTTWVPNFELEIIIIAALCYSNSICMLHINKIFKHNFHRSYCIILIIELVLIGICWIVTLQSFVLVSLLILRYVVDAIFIFNLAFTSRNPTQVNER